ncbi:MAG: hypothetical protein IV084_06765 [Rugosibacter sp.]|nr:hypothetical protein [Rugosibacter sp.]
MYVQDMIYDSVLIHDAIDVVLAWELPDEAFGNAVQAQATLMARCGSD